MVDILPQPGRKILHFPHPVRSEPAPDLTFYDDHSPMERDELKAFIKANQLGDTTLAFVTARPWMGEIKTFNSPLPGREEMEFGLQRCGVRENTARRNLFATVRYVDKLGDGTEYTQERDLEQGTLVLKTVVLSLKQWNLSDETGASIPVNEKTIIEYLAPEEVDFLYEKAIEVNPAWRPGGEAEVKKS